MRSGVANRQYFIGQADPGYNSFIYAGENGNYWSSSATPSAIGQGRYDTYYFVIGSNGVLPSTGGHYTNYNSNGYSLRCLAS